MGKTGGRRPGAGRKKGKVPDALQQARLDIKNMMGPHAESAVKAIVGCLGSNSDQVRLAAAEKILERVYGKPVQVQQVEGGEKPVEIKFDGSKLTKEQRDVARAVIEIASRSSDDS